MTPDDPCFDDGPLVYARFQPVFALEALPHLTAREFRSFLVFENNLHWTSLHRQGTNITADMAGLRKGLWVLLDETRPIGARLDAAVSDVRYMGPAIATAVLHVAYPDKYGVWNSVSEAGLRHFRLWRHATAGESQGDRYAQINETLLALTNAVGVDLWTLDSLWYYLGHEKSGVA